MYSSFANNGHADKMCLLFPHVVDTHCICFRFLFVMFFLRDISFVMSDFVLLLLRIQFLLSDVPLTVIGRCLLHY
jgi:hypothetical protein